MDWNTFRDNILNPTILAATGGDKAVAGYTAYKTAQSDNYVSVVSTPKLDGDNQESRLVYSNIQTAPVSEVPSTPFSQPNILLATLLFGGIIVASMVFK